MSCVKQDSGFRNWALLPVAILAAGVVSGCKPAEQVFGYITTPCPWGTTQVVSSETGTPGLKKFTEKYCVWQDAKGEKVRYGPYSEFYEKGHKKEIGRFDHDGHRTGTWMRWYPGGQVEAKITYDGGKPVTFAAWHENGLRWEEGLFDKGFKNGKWCRWHSNGQKEVESFFDHGVLDHEFIGWHENGQRQERGVYKHGIREGLWVQWHPNGQKRNEILFHDGKPDDWYKAWHENGQQSEQALFHGGKPEGTYTIWHDNGQKEEEGAYHDGVLDGKVTAWDRDGKVWLKTEYKGGSLVDEPPAQPGSESALAQLAEQAAEPPMPAK